MANEEQVALLKQGSEVWNAWREENPETEIDLSEADLRQANLHKSNLRGANLSKTDLIKANLSYSRLDGADLCKANLSYSRLDGADLSSSKLSHAMASSAVFESVNLQNSDLKSANFTSAKIHQANLQGANLENANLCYSYLKNSDLSRSNLACSHLLFADLTNVNLDHANLFHAKLSEANLSFSKMRGANLVKADLISSQLHHADLSYANLKQANLSGADLAQANLVCSMLEGADLGAANLSWANLLNANLQNADLIAASVLGTVFRNALLTGACIADWQIGSSTILEGVKCDYIFRTYDRQRKFSGRLPVDHMSTFAPGEFIQRFQIIASALETIDITFTEGIDWQAFFQSFQELRASRSNEDISIQGMERKGDAFIVRLEVEAEANKAAIETEVKQRYAHQLAALEAQYQERLRLQSDEIATYRQTQTSLLHIVQTMAEKDSISQNFHGPVGNVAGTNHGQMTAYINQNNETISQLIAALRASAQTFPPEQKDDVLMELDDLEGDLSKPDKQEPKRIGKRLQRLIAAGTAAATLAGGAATFSGNVNEFTDNVFELGEKIGLARDVIQINP